MFLQSPIPLLEEGENHKIEYVWAGRFQTLEVYVSRVYDWQRWVCLLKTKPFSLLEDIVRES